MRLTGGGTVLYLTQKTAAIRPMSLKITNAVSGAKTRTNIRVKKEPRNTVTKCRKQHFKSKVQHLVWAQHRWDWGIKYWWESYQPVGQERCPERTSAWAKSWQCSRPAVSRKIQHVKNPVPPKKSFLGSGPWTLGNRLLTRSVAPASMNRARLRWKCCWMIRWPRKGASTIRHTHRKLGIVHGFSCCEATHSRQEVEFKENQCRDHMNPIQEQHHYSWMKAESTR